MTGATGRPNRGRRDNGLDARDFVPLTDVDPRVGEHLLDVLALAGIAAYLQPSSDFNPVVQSTTLPSRPTDRLWADRRYANEARNLLAQHEQESAGDEPAEEQPAPAAASPSAGATGATPAGTATDRDAELDVDAAWEQIIAGYDTPAAGTAPSWPASEDTGDIVPPTTGPAQLLRADHLRPIGPPGPGPRDHSLPEPSDDDPLDSDDEGYTPPTPPPLPKPPGRVVLAVFAILTGFVLFFRPDLLGIGEDLTILVGILGVLGGTAALVYRLREGWSRDDDPDDGAVV